jgi:NADPH-dependent 2,4-dienoyl-CoA reductase/sulfur reductase-like enzyme
VIIGGSFLGLEAATSVKRNFPDKNVTVVEMMPFPLRNVFGPEIAAQLLASHEVNGVKVLTGVSAKRIERDGDRATGVTIVVKDEFRGN